MEDPRRSAEDGRGVTARLDTVSRRLGDGQSHRRLADEPARRADRVRSATDARTPARDRAGAPRSPRAARPPRRRSGAAGRARWSGTGAARHRRAEHVVRGLDVGHPVAHRLVDRVRAYALCL